MPRPTPIIVPGSGGMGGSSNSGEVNISGLVNLLAGIFGPEGLIQKQEALNANQEFTKQAAGPQVLDILQQLVPGTAKTATVGDRVSSGMSPEAQAEYHEAYAQESANRDQNKGMNYLVNLPGTETVKPGFTDIEKIKGSPGFQKTVIDALQHKFTPKIGTQEPVMYERINPTDGKHQTTLFDKHKIDLTSLNQGVMEEQYKWKPYEKASKESPLIKEISGKDPMFEKGSTLRQKNHDSSVSYMIRFDPETNQPLANMGRSSQENRYLQYSAAPNMPPGWDINRKTGEWVFKGSPGGTSKEGLTNIAADWQAVKKSVQVANDSKARNMQASGSALFEGTKDNTGKVVIPATFDRLVQLRDELPEGVLGEFSNKLKAFNKFDQFVKWQTSDPKMAELKSTVIAAAERMGNIYSGGGSVTSDQKMKLAQELIDPTLNKYAFRALVQGHTKDLMNIVNTYGKTWTTTPGQEPKFLPKTEDNTSTPSGASVVDRYKKWGITQSGR